MSSSHPFIHRELVLKCQQGNEKAQYELYGLYANAMFNICRRMTEREEDAQDIMQEVFIDVFAKVHTLKNVDTFSAWIKRITINRCINAIKKKRLVMVDMEESPEPEAEQETDEELMQYTVERIVSSMDKLPAGCKMVMNLYLFEGYDHSEIAQILSVTESASKSQYCKAKRKLRNILSEEENRRYGG